MGYRSDVRLITTEEGWQKLKSFASNYLLEKTGTDKYNYLLDEYIDIFEVDGNSVVFVGWNDIKWYESMEDVDAVMKGLEYLEELDIPYRYARLGEDYTDYTEIYCDSEKGDLPYIYLCRHFDDEESIKWVKEINFKEQNKERYL